MDRTKEYSFVLSTLPRLHARSRLLELGVYITSLSNQSESAKMANHGVFVFANILCYHVRLYIYFYN